MVKSLRDVIGYKRYKELVSDKSGKQLIDLLESYGRISRKLANEKLINTVHDFIKNNLSNVYEFYIAASKDYMQDSAEEAGYHYEVAQKIKLLQNKFKSAKTRLDKVINIDAFMHTGHTSGGNVVARLWEYPAMASFDEITPERYLEYLSDILVKENPRRKNK